LCPVCCAAPGNADDFIQKFSPEKITGALTRLPATDSVIRIVPLSAAVLTDPRSEAVTAAGAPVTLIVAETLYPTEFSVVVAALATGSTTWLAPQPHRAIAAPASAHSDATNLRLTPVMLLAKAARREC
jgi:hypothetical protein